MCEGRFSYDAFVLSNKKDAIYYSGPFSASEKVITINEGEVYKVHGVNATGTITGVSSASGKATVSVSGNEITITGVDTSSSAVIITLTDGNSDTTTITVNVV